VLQPIQKRLSTSHDAAHGTSGAVNKDSSIMVTPSNTNLTLRMNRASTQEVLVKPQSISQIRTQLNFMNGLDDFNQQQNFKSVDRTRQPQMDQTLSSNFAFLQPSQKHYPFKNQFCKTGGR